MPKYFMKKFFSENGILILSAIAIITVTLSIISATSANPGMIRNFFSSFAKPFRAISSSIDNWSNNLSTKFDDVEELQEENAELKKRVAELEAQVNDMNTTKSENEQLREFFNFAEQRNDLTFQQATIIQGATSNWSSSFTLNKGANVGIAKNNCVVDVYGNLVGVISESGNTWSVVDTIIDPDSQIGSLVLRTSNACVASGRLSLMDNNQLELNYLRDSQDIINGDLVVTSGLGGYFPSGIPIGSISEVLPDEAGIYQYAILIPSTNLDSLTHVYVVTDFTVID